MDAADDGQHSGEDEGREMELQLTPIDPKVGDQHSQDHGMLTPNPSPTPPPNYVYMLFMTIFCSY
jgi:hypothetical protein